MRIERAPLVACTVPGLPAPQGSTSRSASGHTYGDNPRTKPWRATIVAVIEGLSIDRRDPVSGPVAVYVVFMMTPPRKIPERYVGYPVTTPDLDKLQRALGDALKTARVLSDDSIIVEWRARKVYAAGDPGMHLRVHRVLS